MASDNILEMPDRPVDSEADPVADARVVVAGSYVDFQWRPRTGLVGPPVSSDYLEERRRIEAAHEHDDPHCR